MRSLEELTSAESSWPALLSLLTASPFQYEVVPVDAAQAELALMNLQVTVHSLMGALTWNSGLVAIDHGWVRLIGAGFGSVPGLHAETLTDASGELEFEGIVAAHDVLGGLFVVHGSGFDAEGGEMLYWAPDTLDWTPLGMGHASLVEFLLSDRMSSFYGDLRWEGWESFVDNVAYDHGVSAYPYPWTKEGSQPNVSRRAVPMSELVAFNFDAARQLGI